MEYYQTKSNKIKRQYYEAEEQGELVIALNEIKAQRKHTKKMSKHYSLQYDKLKEMMHYQSPDSSDDSMSN